MRDPNRIQEFCNRLANIWRNVPDWRFGQLIINMFDRVDSDPFYWEDDRMINYIEGYFEKTEE